MSGSGDNLPEFLKELEDSEDAEGLQELAGALPGASLPVGAISRAGRGKLLAAISELPLRYAPLFGKIGDLADLAEPEVEALVSKLGEEEGWEGGVKPGIKIKMLQGGPKTQGCMVAFAQHDAGTTFPEHRHLGTERYLILVGGLTEADGTHFQAGDIVTHLPGTSHDYVVDSDGECIAFAVVEEGIELL